MATLRPGFVWLAGVRDLQWRRRRFVIAGVGTALVMSLTLLMTGYQATFGIEIDRTVRLINADGYVVQKGRPGPFLGGTPIPVDIARQAAEVPGVEAAAPLIMAPQVTDQKSSADVFLIGADQNGLGAPKPKTGRVARASGEAVIDTASGLDVGDRFGIGGVAFRVVGTVSGLTYNGGRPTVYTSLEDAQRLMFAGNALVTAIAVRGTPTALPDDAVYLSSQDAKKDLQRPLANTISSITMFNVMLWIVAVALVGSVIYLSALERLGDFAVFKATGTGTLDLLGALIVQAVALSVTSSVLAIGLAYLLRPMFPVSPLLPAANQLVLPFVGLLIGLVASGAALRRVVTVDPALAFGS